MGIHPCFSAILQRETTFMTLFFWMTELSLKVKPFTFKISLRLASMKVYMIRKIKTYMIIFSESLAHFEGTLQQG